ncbi:DNA repair protein REV1-like [Antedon mediterranea]|uniref:DNA repair protein REV1-like n=1 Tax=Antedon mediterranea TaxID=105859 RepID=UPI003AF555DF
MMIHGGKFVHYYRKTQVTHIIATNLPHAKIRKLSNEKVIRPEWILDSIKAGRRLSCDSYQLYENRTSLQKSLSFQQNSVNYTTNHDDLPKDTDTEEVNHIDICNALPSKQNLEGTTELEYPNQNTEDSHQKYVESTKKLPSPPSDVKKTSPAKAGDPRFVAEFYNNSRLHHISSWGAEFKELVMQLQKQGDGTFPARDSLRNNVREGCLDQEDVLEEDDSLGEEDNMKPPKLMSHKPDSFTKKKESERYIMHVDMDCFFVSVGLINRPELRGKPVAVTHSRGNGMQQVNLEAKKYEMDYYQNKYGKTMMDDTKTSDGSKSNPGVFNSAAEIASCSYKARAAGVRNGMFMGEAKKRCPSIQTIPYDFDMYKEVAQKLYGIVARYTHDIEAVSCDEMFVDITELLSDTMATPLEFASLLRDEVYKETKCNASIGIAHNILLARMSTRIAKPNGQHLLETNQEMEFIKTQPVGNLPGVGWSTKRRLEALKVTTCEDLQHVTMLKLQREFGAKTGEHLYNLCRGKDERAIQVEKQRKSVSAEINYGIRFTKESESIAFMSEVTEEVHRRLLKISMKGKLITLKMKVRKPGAPKESSKFLGHGICNNVAKSVNLAQATNDLNVLKEVVLGLLRQIKIEPSDMRGVGVQINKLVPESGDQRHPAAIGTKSLKDFVTTGNKTPSVFPIPDVQPAVKKSAPKTMMNFLQKQIDNTNVIPKEVAIPDKLPTETSNIGGEDILPKLPTLMPSPAKEEPVTKSDFYPSSIADIDASVLDALPPDIKLQIKNSFLPSKTNMNHKPTLTSTPVPGKLLKPDYNQPTTSRTAIQSGHTSPKKEELLDVDPSILKELPEDIVQELLANKKSRMQEKKASEGPVEALPNLSQIEPSCLDALPPDIKLQIQNSFLPTKTNINHKPTLTSTPVPVKLPKPDYDQPTTSRTAMQSGHASPKKEELLDVDPSILKELPDDIVQELLANKKSRMQEKKASEGPVEALPNLSQIEPSCLDALPPDMKEELKKAYLQKELKHEQLINEQSPVKLFPPKPSLTKHSPSPRKLTPGKLSPFAVKRRGRPKKTSPRKLFEKNQPKINAMIKSSPIKENKIINDTNKPDGNNHNDINKPKDNKVAEQIEVKDNDVKKKKDEEGTQRANLNGAFEVEEVKALIVEWIETSEFPRDDDLGLVVSFLQELVLERNLVKVDLLLKALKRYTNKTGEDKWKKAYTTALALVQDRVCQVYNSQLKIS